VVLKATYDPRWHVTVDGKQAIPYMVVPGFVAVSVEAGPHSIVFQYVAYSHYALLLAVGGLTLVLLALGPWSWRRWGYRLRSRRSVVSLRGLRIRGAHKE
jgi:hypothetical protein